jgi:hypothetical protein
MGGDGTVEALVIDDQKVLACRIQCKTAGGETARGRLFGSPAFAIRANRGAVNWCGRARCIAGATSSTILTGSASRMSGAGPYGMGLGCMSGIKERLTQTGPGDLM